MATDTQDKPGLDERYIGATNSSNLRLDPDVNCDATHLIAAGLLGNRMGAALAHLRAEWDAAEKLRKATEDEIVARAEELPKRKGKTDVKRARAELFAAYTTAHRHRAHKLGGWLPALSIMAEWAVLKGVDVDLLSPALYHHLSPACHVCSGLGNIRMDDAPVLGKQCYACEGRGTPKRSFEAERVDSWLKSCLGKAKGDRGGLLRGEIDAEEMADRRRRRAANQGAATEDERGAAAVAEVARAAMGMRRRL